MKYNCINSTLKKAIICLCVYLRCFSRRSWFKQLIQNYQQKGLFIVSKTDLDIAQHSNNSNNCVVVVLLVYRMYILSQCVRSNPLKAPNCVVSGPFIMTSSFILFLLLRSTFSCTPVYQLSWCVTHVSNNCHAKFRGKPTPLKGGRNIL